MDSDQKHQLEENHPEKVSNTPESELETDESFSGSDSSSGSSSSSESINAEWARFLDKDGSLLYVESYVSSTVKERQAHQAAKALSDYDKKGHFSPPQKNLKRHTKLLNLLKRRPSVRVKSSSGVVDAGKVGSGSGQDAAAASPPKVTFRDNPCGEVREVNLRVSNDGNNFGRRATFCEAVLGIMPGRFNEPPDSRIMVAGLAPGSQALKDSSIKIGDWLKSVNGAEVYWENLDGILMNIQIPSSVTLTVQKCAAETLPPEDHHSLKRVTQTRLVKFLIGKEKKTADWNSLMERGMLPLHVVLHLSLSGVTEESPEKADIRYQFPLMNSKLVQVRGMFLTLSHSLQEVVGSPVRSATVTLHGIHYNSAFWREEDDVFLIIIPSFCISEADLNNVMEQLCKLIRFEFGTLSRGLSDPSCKETLDHLFLLLFEDLLSLEESVGVGQSPSTGGHVPPFTPSTSLTIGGFTDLKSRLAFGAANLLVLRDDFAKIQIEMCLNELQSGDFGDNDSDCEDCLMLYNIIGCSIFYKNRLVLSHLDAESSECVFLFVERHRLLHLVDKEPVSQLVLWQKVYLPLPEEDNLSNKDIDHYLLIVGMNHFLLATLVESGNVTELMDKDAGPDPFLVDQAETTLYHLHSLHVQVACEESLLSSPVESILPAAKGTSPINKKASKSGGKVPPNLEGTPTRSPDVPSILKQKSSPTFEPRESPTCDCERSWGEGSEDSHSHSPHSRDASLVEEDDDDEGRGEKNETEEDRSSSRGDTSSDSDWRIGKGYDNRGSHTNKIDGFKGLTPHSLRVTVGEENVLFHLLQLDVGEGVIITPYFGDGGEIPRLHTELVRNFHSVISHIRNVLHAGQRNKNKSCNYIGSTVLDSSKEFGIYFECPDQSKNSKSVLNYWVIGRLFGAPYEREIYVALEDSVPQNMQEIAFKMALGC